MFCGTLHFFMSISFKQETYRGEIMYSNNYLSEKIAYSANTQFNLFIVVTRACKDHFMF